MVKYPNKNNRADSFRLNRRAAFASLIPSAFVGYSFLKAQQTNTNAGTGVFPLQRLIGDLAIATGKYAGAYRSTPNGPVNWYFANLGLAFLITEFPDAIRAYLDVYIRSLDPWQSFILDVAADLVTPVPPDSNDAYAGTFLTLAVKYVRATRDSTWWTANLGRLKAVAYSNILTQIKTNGLVRGFQAPNVNQTGYLMDQCEVYSGLRDFGQYLIETNDPDADYYASFAMHLGIAIHTLFDINANRWQWCDVPSPASNAWYPNLTAQIYPHLYDVHSNDAPGDYYRLHQGFTVLNQEAPDWPFKPQDLYPWLVVGYYAVSQQNLDADATEMLSMVLQYYLPGLVNTGYLLISEIGYVHGIMDLVSSKSKSS